MSNTKQAAIRKTSQHELPIYKEQAATQYDIYPTHPIGPGLIATGYDALAKALALHDCIKIDGYVGILFEEVKERLHTALAKKGVVPQWVDVQSALKEEEHIDALIAPYLGDDDPVFGRLAHPLALEDFFNAETLQSLAAATGSSPVIFYGTGAALIPRAGKTVYVDISKNEIQFRSRAGSVLNLGASRIDDPKAMYKRFYFVDWLVLNKHKNTIQHVIDFLVDGQRSEDITWMEGDVWRESMNTLLRSPIRVRPWFEPGAWGGQWIKEYIDGIAKEVVNYAWSFELIVPENGIIAESSGIMLEYSFDFLMYHAGKAVLGQDFETYGHTFPIRFDFLDTFDGGNLSVQCHPQKAYIQQHFGETITQEETYYILDRKEGAEVYLGFQEGVDPASFRAALEKSRQEKQAIDINAFVHTFTAHKHDLFLIPPGTIHSSGKNNLVLEISATPYIYTFKMYDWLRLDLEGNPRPLNIERGMENLNFERAGERVKQELLATPTVIDSTQDWEWEHLPTHAEHLYDIHRYHIKTEVRIYTDEKVHVLSLVEGEKIAIVTEEGTTVYAYAECFVIPAAVSTYTIRNLSQKPATVIKAFIK